MGLSSDLKFNLYFAVLEKLIAQTMLILV